MSVDDILQTTDSSSLEAQKASPSLVNNISAKYVYLTCPPKTIG